MSVLAVGFGDSTLNTRSTYCNAGGVGRTNSFARSEISRTMAGPGQEVGDRRVRGRSVNARYL